LLQKLGLRKNAVPLIDCNIIAKRILKTVEGGTLAVLRNYDDPSAISYVRQLYKAAQKSKISLVEEDYNSKWVPDGVNRLIEKNNKDPEVDGIIVVSPAPSHYRCLDNISPQKRVEGNDFDDDVARVLCTARAIVYIIESVEKLEEKNVLILGYGKTVGKPLSYLLMRGHVGSVTTTHKYTPTDDLWDYHIPNADIIVSAVGSPHFLFGHFHEKIIIDAGISVKDGKLFGDVHPELIDNNLVSPVPGGVGPVTTALLLQNVAKAARGEF